MPEKLCFEPFNIIPTMEADARRSIYHALYIDHKTCIGCSHCMKRCPTQAIRLVHGRAVIRAERCIDCGRCYDICPQRGIHLQQDDFEKIHAYKHSVALIPAVFLAQFPDDVPVGRIYEALRTLGFTHVFEVESTTAIYSEAKERYAREHPDVQPLISAFCPSIVRLIQVKYPSLVDNIMPLRSPCDLSALCMRRRLARQGVPENEIGVFYVTPCAANLVAVKSVATDEEPVNGNINMDLLFNRAYRLIKQQGKDHEAPSSRTPYLSADSILSTLNNGERRLSTAERSYAVDGLENVVEILDKVEDGELEGVNFLELRSCTLSCAGASLAMDNRFLSSERMYKRARLSMERERNGEVPHDRSLQEDKEYLLAHAEVAPIRARDAMALDTDIGKALEKAEQIERLTSYLPRIDCGFCGAPTCEVFATDVVNGKAQLSACIFERYHRMERGDLESLELPAMLHEVWGENRIKEERE